MYSVSPVHTDAMYVAKTSELIAHAGVDAIMLKDPSGLLTLDRVRTLAPVLKRVCGSVPLEFHSHALTGLAPLLDLDLEAARLGIETVVGVSDADRQTLAAKMADRAICIGPAPAAESYLRMETIVTAAQGTGCQAIHPGYGFLAENAAFQRLCGEQSLIFVGPPASAMSAMGDKLTARQTAKKLKVPVIPGAGHVDTPAKALAFGREIGYPFLLKASAGGGGRGMRVVRSPDEVAGAFAGASAEARAAFNDSTLYIERYIER